MRGVSSPFFLRVCFFVNVCENRSMPQRSMRGVDDELLPFILRICPPHFAKNPCKTACANDSRPAKRKNFVQNGLHKFSKFIRERMTPSLF